jgi:hypothetical protein
MLSADGTEVTDGVRTLTVSKATDLPSDGTVLSVSGAGFDPARGIYVSLCRLGGAGPGPCLTGSPSVSAWVTSDPPAYADDLALPFAPGGTFEVELSVTPTIDAGTDCREDPCAIVVRRDDQAPDDRSLDLAIPVEFADAQATTTTSAVVADEELAGPPPPADDRGSSPSGLGAIAVLVAVAAGVAGGVVAVLGRRRKAMVGPAT